MEINLVELWKSMGLPIRGVVILLFIQGVACLAVVFDRLLLLIQASRRAGAAAAVLQPALESAQYDKALQVLSQAKPNHLTQYLEVGLRTFLNERSADQDNLRAGELARRALGRKGDAISRELYRGMNVLASTGSTAPFIGLLGTVLGIINAFKGIAATGSGGIGAIGGSISEALVVTGFGLLVAIPAVLIFNWLSAKIANYEAGLVNAGGELIDRLETGHRGVAPAGQRPLPSDRARVQTPAAAER